MTDLFDEIERQRATVDAAAEAAGAEVVCYDHGTLSTNSSVSYGQCPGCQSLAARVRETDRREHERRIRQLVRAGYSEAEASEFLAAEAGLH